MVYEKGKVFLAIAIVTMFSSCDLFMGQDGQDGEAYIAYSWVVGPILFRTNDPAFGDDEYIVNGQYRTVVPGTYQYEYIAWDDSYWWGEYTVYIEEGEPGLLFYDGFDGEDLYFELACYSFGPSFYVWDEDFAYLSKGDGVVPNAAGIIDWQTGLKVAKSRLAELRSGTTLSVFSANNEDERSVHSEKVRRVGLK